MMTGFVWLVVMSRYCCGVSSARMSGSVPAVAVVRVSSASGTSCSPSDTSTWVPVGVAQLGVHEGPGLGPHPREVRQQARGGLVVLRFKLEFLAGCALVEGRGEGVTPVEDEGVGVAMLADFVRHGAVALVEGEGTKPRRLLLQLRARGAVLPVELLPKLNGVHGGGGYRAGAGGCSPVGNGCRAAAVDDVRGPG
jgi:hypothetical protein